MNRSMPHWLVRILKLSSIVSLLVSVYLAFCLYQINKTSINTAQSSAITTTKKTAEYVNHFITLLQRETEKLVPQLAGKQLEKEIIQKALEQKPTEISGLGIIINPEKDSSGFYYVEKDDKQQHIQLSNQDIKKLDWLTTKEQFIGPVTDPITHQPTIVYVKPIPSKNALLFATQSIAHLNHILSTLRLGKSGYWILTDQQGTIIRYPQKKIVQRSISFESILKEKNISVDQKVLAQKSGITTYDNEITDNASWLVFEPIESINWTLFGVFDIQETSHDQTTYRHYVMLIVLTLLVGLLCAIPLFVSRYSWWVLVLIMSSFLVAAIASIWFIAQRYPHTQLGVIPIQDKISLYRFLDTQSFDEKDKDELSLEKLKHYLRYRYKTGKYVPTGIYVKELGLTSPETIDFVGYIWQRYFDGIHDGVSRGFILPQIAQEPDITEISRSKENKTETIIWQVNAQLNQQLNYALYPFDDKQLTIQLRHKDVDKNIVLVPDLDAYPLINPSALPGMSKDVYISGWNTEKGAFEYQIEDYRTNFGLYAYGPFGIYKTTESSTYPLLTFGTTVKRNLLQALLTDVLPLIVIALLLFICFITDILQGFSGFVPSLAGLFFGAIISHLAFRGKIPPHELVYLETFYLIIYAFLVLITILSMLNMFKVPIPWIAYKNNRIAKLLYWPVLLSSVLVVTVWYLY